MLILLSKIFLEFILESPTFLRGSRNHCEAILPGKMMIFDSRYSVLVWELVSYWPVFPYFSFEACIFFTFQFPFFLYLGWYVWQCRSNQQYYNCHEFYGLWSLWQYGLWSFQTRYTKLERILCKNQHTQRKLLNFENWTNEESQVACKNQSL